MVLIFLEGSPFGHLSWRFKVDFVTTQVLACSCLCKLCEACCTTSLACVTMTVLKRTAVQCADRLTWANSPCLRVQSVGNVHFGCEYLGYITHRKPSIAATRCSKDDWKNRNICPCRVGSSLVSRLFRCFCFICCGDHRVQSLSITSLWLVYHFSLIVSTSNFLIPQAAIDNLFIRVIQNIKMEPLRLT